MDKTSVTAAGAIGTFLVLLIGIGPKAALVPFLQITASLAPAGKLRVQRKMDRPGNLGGPETWRDAGSWQRIRSTPRPRS